MKKIFFLLNIGRFYYLNFSFSQHQKMRFLVPVVPESLLCFGGEIELSGVLLGVFVKNKNV